MLILANYALVNSTPVRVSGLLVSAHTHANTPALLRVGLAVSLALCIGTVALARAFASCANAAAVVDRVSAGACAAEVQP